jgi:hypothetical protein
LELGDGGHHEALDGTATVGHRWVWALDTRDAIGERPWFAISDDDPRRYRPGIVKRLLIPNDPVTSVQCSYKPLEDEHGLHRLFAATEATESGIMQFANQYGRLELKRQDVNVTGLLNLNVLVAFPADSFQDWKTEIVDLQGAIAEWDASKKTRSATSLERISAAMNKRLDLITIPVPSQDGTRLRMSLKPKNLCSAIWLQFARETEGIFDLLRCRKCGKWFKYFPQQIKTPRRFCSQACRSKAYRGRPEEARALFAKGLTLAQIVEHVGSEGMPEVPLKVATPVPPTLRRLLPLGNLRSIQSK